MTRSTPAGADFEPANVVGPFAGPVLDPVELAFIEADRLARRSA